MHTIRLTAITALMTFAATPTMAQEPDWATSSRACLTFGRKLTLCANLQVAR
jgi:hypothetical protein